MGNTIDVTAPSQVSLALKDTQSYRSGTYWESDLLGEATQVTLLSGTGDAKLGAVTPAGSPSVPAGYANADLDQRTGFAYASTAALNDFGAFQAGQTYFAVYPNSPSTQLTLVFCTPKVLSTAGDRYSVNYGWFYPNNGAVPYHGWALTYSDNVNSGNWVFNERIGNVTSTTQNCSVAPAANTWYQLVLTVANKQLSATLTPAGGSAVTLFSGLTSAQLNGGNPVPTLLGGLQILRQTFTSGTIGGLVDYSSIYSAGTTRT